MRFLPERFRDKQACVLGLGRSGLACANLLADKGFKVLVSEARPRKQALEDIRKLHYHVHVEAGGHSARVQKAGFLVKSPGMSPRAPVLELARKNRVPVFSELEVALAFAPSPRLYAVTGTNGKTTTTRLLGAILAASGARVHVAGNIGEPLSGRVRDMTVGDTLALEVSSYQLEDSQWFKPDAACLLNLTPDHLDHHGSWEAYVEAKARLFKFQGPKDTCVFFADDAAVKTLSRRCPARRLFFSMKPGRGVAAWPEKGRLRVRLGGKTLDLIPPALPGDHNLQNAMAAALMALARGVPAAAVQSAFRDFRGVEHRLEEAGTIRGIRCVNDSKATNVDSTVVGLRAFPEARGNILLILGGLDKGAPYAPLRPEIERKVRAVFTIGSAADKIERELAGAADFAPCGTLEKAVAAALERGKAGDILLLSPACASFDQFKDYEDRGRRFKEIVSTYAGRQTPLRAA